LTLKSGTKDPVFESYHVKDNQVVLNIIDTSGLFERSNNEIDIRDNETILKTIGICINREITKFHVVCFCVAITEGINQ
jgi:predicted GTPase